MRGRDRSCSWVLLFTCNKNEAIFYSSIVDELNCRAYLIRMPILNLCPLNKNTIYMYCMYLFVASVLSCGLWYINKHFILVLTGGGCIPLNPSKGRRHIEFIHLGPSTNDVMQKWRNFPPPPPPSQHCSLYEPI